jgi:hypothetical protein
LCCLGRLSDLATISNTQESLSLFSTGKVLRNPHTTLRSLHSISPLLFLSPALSPLVLFSHHAETWVCPRRLRLHTRALLPPIASTPPSSQVAKLREPHASFSSNVIPASVMARVEGGRSGSCSGGRARWWSVGQATMLRERGVCG